MPQPTITLLILDDHGANVRRVTFSRGSIAKVIAAVSLVVIAVLAVLVHYVLILGHVFEARDLRIANAALSQRLDSVGARLQEAEVHVASLEPLEGQLRNESGLDAVDAVPPMARAPARGGAGPFSTDVIAAAVEGDDVAGITARLDRLDARLVLVTRDAAREGRSFSDLVHYFDGRELLLRSTPSIAPTRGVLTSGFGQREDPFTNLDSGHSGDDIAAPIGTDVFAPADALVIHAGPNGGYGNCIILEHRAGLTTLYGHLSSILVEEGMRVVRGQRIGRVGTTGRSTGPHLHYEVRVNGVAVNPQRFILQ